MMIETGVNGFGRIGMLYSRAAIDDPELAVRAINAGGELDAHDTAVRLEYDTVHRNFGMHEIDDAGDSIVVDGEAISIHSFRKPKDGPWGEVGEGLIVIEATGKYLSRRAAQGHIEAGAKGVVITAPARDRETPTIVRGVNDTEENLARVNDTAAVSSCSTNCIAPILKVLDDRFGVWWGIAETTHAYTNSQRPLDGRGTSTVGRRSLGSIIPASTGSATEISRLFPDLQFFDSSSKRVNSPDGSVAALTIGLSSGSIQEQDIIDSLQEASETTHEGIIGISRRGMFSDRVIGQTSSAVVDLRELRVHQKVLGETIVKLDAWFDNEWAYANRVAEVAKLVGRQLA